MPKHDLGTGENGTILAENVGGLPVASTLFARRALEPKNTPGDLKPASPISPISKAPDLLLSQFILRRFLPLFPSRSLTPSSSQAYTFTNQQRLALRQAYSEPLYRSKAYPIRSGNSKDATSSVHSIREILRAPSLAPLGLPSTWMWAWFVFAQPGLKSSTSWRTILHSCSTVRAKLEPIKDFQQRVQPFVRIKPVHPKRISEPMTTRELICLGYFS